MDVSSLVILYLGRKFLSVLLGSVRCKEVSVNEVQLYTRFYIFPRTQNIGNKCVKYRVEFIFDLL